MGDLIFRNPMLIEAKRFARRFFGVSRQSGANTTLLVIAALLYALLLLVVIASRGALNSIVIIYFQTALLIFIAPIVTHASIAGEREKRSWDFLIVAPISKPQIAIGKFMSGLIVTGTVFLLMLGPTLIAYNGLEDHPLATLNCELVSLSFVVGLQAVTLYLSASNNKAFTVLIFSYALLLCFFVIWPLLVSNIDPDKSNQSMLVFLNPFYGISNIASSASASQPSVSTDMNPAMVAYSGWAYVLAYGFVSAGALWLTTLGLLNETKDRRKKRSK